MIRARAVAAVLAGACLAGGVGGARADDGDLPGVNDLRLQVERLERAEHAEVTGSSASAMLFDPEQRAAAVAEAAARRLARRGVTASLFRETRTPSWTPAPTTHLFVAQDYARVTASRDAPVEDEGITWPVLPLAASALAAGGAGASTVLRDRGVRSGG